eukprot:2752554-Prymnesium_polylepis.1
MVVGPSAVMGHQDRHLRRRPYTFAKGHGRRTGSTRLAWHCTCGSPPRQPRASRCARAAGCLADHCVPGHASGARDTASSSAGLSWKQYTNQGWVA